jgi:hypothetical protein
MDMEKPHTTEEYTALHGAHEYLKQMERGLTAKAGTVVLK